jgi:formate C-acetyltransferase
MEKLYPRLHAGVFYSSTFSEYAASGRDVFVDFGAKYNNTSICGIGLATAVDSLMAVKKMDYEDRIMTFKELGELMRNNWEGQEALRLTVKNKYPKYGMGDPEVDRYAADLVEQLASMINARPNAKGGVYRLGLHSITVRWIMGAALAATPDGRLAGESTSLNTGASMGADRNGATGHILSVTSLDATLSPNSVTLDLDLHSSATSGESGLNALYATLKTYLKRGGFSIHYNVLDTEVLKDAQKHPENYPNLQVRLCGWNARFSRLSKEHQDEYIARSQINK